MPKKILIIDDEPDLVKMVQSRLEANNYEVVSAGNGQEGLEKYIRERPDLILLDIMMPKMEGFTFVQGFKDIGDLKTTPIVMLTAKDSMKDTFMLEGIEDYITKPFQAEELLEIIKKRLG